MFVETEQVAQFVHQSGGVTRSTIGPQEVRDAEGSRETGNSSSEDGVLTRSQPRPTALTLFGLALLTTADQAESHRWSRPMRSPFKPPCGSNNVVPRRAVADMRSYRRRLPLRCPAQGVVVALLVISFRVIMRQELADCFLQ